MQTVQIPWHVPCKSLNGFQNGKSYDNLMCFPVSFMCSFLWDITAISIAQVDLPISEVFYKVVLDQSDTFTVDDLKVLVAYRD